MAGAKPLGDRLGCLRACLVGIRGGEMPGAFVAAILVMALGDVGCAHNSKEPGGVVDGETHSRIPVAAFMLQKWPERAGVVKCERSQCGSMSIFNMLG